MSDNVSTAHSGNLIDLDKSASSWMVSSASNQLHVPRERYVVARCILDQTAILEEPLSTPAAASVGDKTGYSPSVAALQAALRQAGTSPFGSHALLEDSSFYDNREFLTKVIDERQKDIEFLWSSLEETLHEKSVLEKELRQKDYEIFEANSRLKVEAKSNEELGQFYDLEYKTVLNERNDVQRKLAEMSTRNRSLELQLRAEAERSSRLEQRVVTLENVCDAADSSEAKYKAEIADLTRHLDELRNEQRRGNRREVVAVAASGDCCDNREDQLTNHAVSGSAIMEAGQLQISEAEKYQLRKLVRRMEKEKEKMAQEIQELKLQSRKMRFEEHKENDFTRSFSFHRAVSCDSSPRRVLQASGIPNSPVANADASNNHTSYQNRYFPAILPNAKRFKF